MYMNDGEEGGLGWKFWKGEMLALMLTVNLWTLVEGRRAWKENKYVFTAGESIKKKNSRVEEIIVLQFERMFEFISRRLKKKSR